MERLKALLYCLRCHLVLLIFILLGAGGYWLRDDLSRYFGMEAKDAGVAVPVGPRLAATPPSPVSSASPSGSPAAAVASAPLPARPKTVQELAADEGFSFRPNTEDGALIVPDAPGREALLNQARRAYWNGDIRQAVVTYQKLLDAFPDQPDYLGELGNIYYQEGAKQLAASYYYDSARLLLRRGERSRVEKLAAILQPLAPQYASDLETRLASGTGNPQ